jgi:hypothetical protein
MQFRRLPPFGGDPRAVAEILNLVLDGKTNNTGLITLNTGNATSTTLYDERISPDTKIVLIPFSNEAEADSAPYGQFLDTTDQAATTIGTENILGLNTTDLSNGVYLSNGDRINFRNAGKYAIQFSIQVVNSTNDVQSIDIWFKKNGSNVALSNSKFGIKPRKSTGADSQMIAATMVFFDLAANDYIQIAWRPTDIGVSFEHFAAVAASAGVTPAIPETPTAIITVQYIAPYAYSNIYVTSQTKGEAVITHFSNDTANKTYAYIIVG